MTVILGFAFPVAMIFPFGLNFSRERKAAFVNYMTKEMFNVLAKKHIYFSPRQLAFQGMICNPGNDPWIRRDENDFNSFDCYLFGIDDIQCGQMEVENNGVPPKN